MFSQQPHAHRSRHLDVHSSISFMKQQEHSHCPGHRKPLSVKFLFSLNYEMKSSWFLNCGSLWAEHMLENRCRQPSSSSVSSGPLFGGRADSIRAQRRGGQMMWEARPWSSPTDTWETEHDSVSGPSKPLSPDHCRAEEHPGSATVKSTLHEVEHSTANIESFWQQMQSSSSNLYRKRLILDMKHWSSQLSVCSV